MSCKHVAPLTLGPGPHTVTVAGFAGCPFCRIEELESQLKRLAPEPGAAALGAAGYQMDETGFGTYKLTMGFPDMETLHAASAYVRRLRAAK